MAHVLCVWEMGGNLGHIANLKYFIDTALQRGHQVSVAVRELQQVATLLNVSKVKLYQAPVPVVMNTAVPLVNGVPIEIPGSLISYSELLLKQVFSNAEHLLSLCCAWRSLFEAVKPDLVIYDHAPAALIASYSMPWQKWIIGSGFLIPRTDAPFLGVFPGLKKTPENDARLAKADQALLTLVNQVLSSLDYSVMNSPAMNSPAMDNPKVIIDQCDKKLFLTIDPLDHCGRRPDAYYMSLPGSMAGIEPQWLQISGKKVFAYLSNFSGLVPLLDFLHKENVNLMIYARDLPADIKQKYADRVLFCDKPVNLDFIHKTADIVINHANHKTALQAFTDDIPQLLLPKHQEQFMLAKRLEQHQRAIIAPASKNGLPEAWRKLGKLPAKGVCKKYELPSEASYQQMLVELFIEAGF